MESKHHITHIIWPRQLENIPIPSTNPNPNALNRPSGQPHRPEKATKGCDLRAPPPKSVDLWALAVGQPPAAQTSHKHYVVSKSTASFCRPFSPRKDTRQQIAWVSKLPLPSTIHMLPNRSLITPKLPHRRPEGALAFKSAKSDLSAFVSMEPSSISLDATSSRGPNS